jgi:hypothetical protein
MGRNPFPNSLHTRWVFRWFEVSYSSSPETQTGEQSFSRIISTAVIDYPTRNDVIETDPITALSLKN